MEEKVRKPHAGGGECMGCKSDNILAVCKSSIASSTPGNFRTATMSATGRLPTTTHGTTLPGAAQAPTPNHCTNKLRRDTEGPINNAVAMSSNIAE